MPRPRCTCAASWSSGAAACAINIAWYGRKKFEWAQPGCLGPATDRANKDGAVFRTAKIGDYTADLTEDIELWYTGAVANHGWIWTLEPVGSRIYLPSPYCPRENTGKHWKLQITFEPK